jgi:hypothetical protein
MRTPQSRKCTLLDAMTLVAATAVGLSVVRTYTLDILNIDLTPYPLIPSFLLAIWVRIVALLPLPAIWSIAVFALGLRRPRPPLRRLVRRPGFVATGAVCLVAAIKLAGFLVLIARTIGNRFYILGQSLVDSFIVTPAYRGPVRVGTIHATAYFASSAMGISLAVAAAWLLLAVSGRWRSEPDWLDRLGRGLGTFWIGIIPLSCWWDYHVLY